MRYVNIGGRLVSQFIIGSNPFSGFSHQSPEVDTEMRRYFTVERIKGLLREAEGLGVNTLVARTDHHIVRMLLEYGDEGGALQWFAQTCPEVGSHQVCVERAAASGAVACHIHGGVMDYLVAQNRTEEIPGVIELIRSRGMLAGLAGHNPRVFEWAEANVDVDYYLCCYYNSAHRDERAEHVSGMSEWFCDEDRQTMVKVIAGLSKPVIHYKIMAAGRNDPAEAFAFAAANMRANDAACVGIYPRDTPDMLQQDVDLLCEGLCCGGRNAAAPRPTD